MIWLHKPSQDPITDSLETNFAWESRDRAGTAGGKQEFHCMLFRGNCKQRKYSSGSEMSPHLAHSLPELDPKLDFPTDLQRCQWDAQDFKEK